MIVQYMPIERKIKERCRQTEMNMAIIRLALIDVAIECMTVAFAFPGSVGATVRMYIEKYEPDVSKQGLMTADVLRSLVDIGLKLSKLEEFTGRSSPTVIT